MRLFANTNVQDGEIELVVQHVKLGRKRESHV